MKTSEPIICTVYRPGLTPSTRSGRMVEHVGVNHTFTAYAQPGQNPLNIPEDWFTRSFEELDFATRLDLAMCRWAFRKQAPQHGLA